jgi:hypothetical protein
VVVFYNMKRRRPARCTRCRGPARLGDITYDVVVVDNGSAPEQRLDEAYVRASGPEFRFVDMGDGPSSPIPHSTGASPRAGHQLAP